MIEETRTIYTCPHCRKYYKRKDFCEKHIQQCKENPVNNRPCFTCQHLDNVRAEMAWDIVGGSIYGNFMYCKYHERFTHPPQVDIKGNKRFPNGETSRSMPHVCADHSDWQSVLDKIM